MKRVGKLGLLFIILIFGLASIGGCSGFLSCIPDTNAPIVVITSPPNRAYVNGIVPIQVTATDNVGVSKVVFYVDNIEVGNSVSAPYIYNWDTYGLQNGSIHTIYVKAYDYAGNVGTSQVVQVTIGTSWTFMVYMNGDNSLSSYTTYDLQEMESVGSRNGINIIVQLDTYGNNGCWRYMVRQGSLDLLAQLPELDSGSPDTLRDFANWAMQNYPAKYYALIIWDHGNGWRRATTTKGISQDETSNSIISSVGLKQAINQMTNRINLLGMDACLMSTVEVAYQVRGNADYLVGSEESEPANGWPYNTILSALADNPYMSPRDLASIIVDRYVASYSSSDVVTQSALDLSRIDSLVSSCDALAQTLISNMSVYKSMIQNAVSHTQHYSGDPNQYDLYDFAYNLLGINSSIYSAASNVMSNVQSVVVNEAHSSSGGVGNSHGLSVWIPNPTDYSNSISTYLTLDFAISTHWPQFLQALLQ
ncbi:MAG: clostripain-related cysteine peptidase [bacterium]